MVTENLETKCIWKMLTDIFGEALPGEGLNKCLNNCNGYQMICKDYLSKGQYEDEYNGRGK